MALPASMDEVLSLTKAGRLGDATTLIQRLLHGNDPGEMWPAPRETGSGSIRAQMPLLAFDNFSEDHDPPRAKGPSKARGRPKAKGRPAPVEGMTRQLYEGREGRIAYRLFVPPGLVGPAPLLVMLHGCTQSPEDFARGTQMNELAAEFGFLVAYPEQTNAANPQKCWNWFRPGDQERGRGEPALIAAVTKAIVAQHPVEPERVYVAGLSAGGAAASIMAETYPDLYAAVGIHSGLPCGSAKDLPSAFAAMKGSKGQRASRPSARFVPTITFHGDRDQTVHPSNSETIFASGIAHPKLAEFERRTSEGTSPGGRKFRRTVLVDGKDRNWIEHWEIRGGGHAWSGGDAAGSYTDPSGPDSSRAMMEFFLQHRLSERL